MEKRTADRVLDVVIVGGGTAGWMTAAALAKVLSREYRIKLIESDEIGTVGVGEATIPQIKLFNNVLQLDEDDFVRNTQGTFKLGIQFVNWGGLGDRYIHGFGSIGQDLGVVPFHHYWLKHRQRAGQGGARDIAAFSLNTAAGPLNRFMRSQDMGHSPLSNIAYAYHFDAGLYAAYLRRYAEALGVVRLEGKVVHTELRSNDGFVESVKLADGRVIAGQLFIDCSGFRGLLIEQALHTGYEDWSHWLPCDRAIAVPCARVAEPTPYTRSTAHTAGWQWRIPLQHRTGNGHVFSSAFMGEEEARRILMGNLDGEPLAEPRTLKFVTGRRRKFWNKNVVAIGLASGFMEPLESTSIHLIQSGIKKLIDFFPTTGFDPVDIRKYNQQSDWEFERIRDFLILHYHVTERNDSPFWNYCRTMDVPVELTEKLELFKANARFVREGDELFHVTSWVQVMLGQRLNPRHYHPMVDLLSDTELNEFVQGIGTVIDRCVAAMPGHDEFIQRFCAAPKMAMKVAA
jgi:tryptophan 7-halogenase